MRELPTEKLLIYGCSLLLVVILTPLLSRIPRSGGTNTGCHILFVVAVALTLGFLPVSIQNEVFSPGGVVVVGTIVPIYESIVAVCTIGEADDNAWLQFWITSGSLAYCTEFIDNIRDVFPKGGEHWYEFEFFFTLWLLLPFTDGAAAIQKYITKPLFAPIAHRMKGVFEGWIQCVIAAVNASHLWFLWFVFMSFPEEQRRFITVAMGTIYPTAASIAAVSQPHDSITSGADTTFWLTYWSAYSVLFLLMDYLENFIGHIRGFYSICLVATVYLFLPMFNGAETVFRKVLVPLSGQYENMLLRDVHKVQLEMEKLIPAKSRSSVLQKAADIFTKAKYKSS
ncbi:hypothetical protein ACHAW6_007495 [Cyclotella cf. meneghiniana]